VKAGVPAGHPHALRHTFGTALAEAGVDLAVLRELMGLFRKWSASEGGEIPVDRVVSVS
jgi:site-specific recombinase XerC